MPSASTPPPPPFGLTAVALSLLAAILWGGTPVAVRYSVDALPPVAIGAVRFALAAAFMVIWCRIEGVRVLPRRTEWLPMGIAGALLFGQISLFNWSLALSSASHATILINTAAFWVVALEHWITRTDRLTTRKASGLFVAFLGVVLLFSASHETPTASGDPTTWGGDLLMVASAALLGVKIVVTKQSLRRTEPGRFMLWHHIFGVVFLTLWSVSFEVVALDRIDRVACVSILYQGILVAGLCFGIQAKLLRRHSATQVSVFNFCIPVFGLVAAFLFRGDPLTLWVLASVLAIAIGIYLVTRGAPNAKVQ